MLHYNHPKACTRRTGHGNHGEQRWKAALWLAIRCVKDPSLWGGGGTNGRKKLRAGEDNQTTTDHYLGCWEEGRAGCGRPIRNTTRTPHAHLPFLVSNPSGPNWRYVWKSLKLTNLQQTKLARFVSTTPATMAGPSAVMKATVAWHNTPAYGTCPQSLLDCIRIRMTTHLPCHHHRN